VIDASPYIATGPLPVATWNVEDDAADEIMPSEDEEWAASDEAGEPAAEEVADAADSTESTDSTESAESADEFAMADASPDEAVEDLAAENLGDAEGWSTEPAAPLSDEGDVPVAAEEVVTEWTDQNLATELEGATLAEDTPEEPITQAQGWNADSSATDEYVDTAPAEEEWSEGEDLEWSTDDADSEGVADSGGDTDEVIDFDDEAQAEADVDEVEVQDSVDAVQIDVEVEETGGALAEDDWEYLEGGEESWDDDGGEEAPAASAASE
jgi:hypothetical protein